MIVFIGYVAFEELEDICQVWAQEINPEKHERLCTAEYHQETKKY